MMPRQKNKGQDERKRTAVSGNPDFSYGYRSALSWVEVLISEV